MANLEIPRAISPFASSDALRYPVGLFFRGLGAGGRAVGSAVSLVLPAPQKPRDRISSIAAPRFTEGIGDMIALVEGSQNADAAVDLGLLEMGKLLAKGMADEAVPDTVVADALKSAVMAGLDAETFESLEVGPLTRSEMQVLPRLAIAEMAVDIHRTDKLTA